MNRKHRYSVVPKWSVFFLTVSLLFPASSFAQSNLIDLGPALDEPSGGAAPSQEVIEKCMRAVDFQGCVRALSGSQTIPDQSTNVSIPSTSATPNTCPPGYGYRGAGMCQEVRCTCDRSLDRNRFDKQLDGKGWSCDKCGWFFRAKPIFDGPVVPAGVTKACPSAEPEFGRESSCGNSRAGQ